MKIKISLAQTNIHYVQTIQNLEKAIHIVAKAAAEGSQLILFPELWSSGFDLVNSAHYARQNKVMLDNLATLAKDHHIAIGGSLLLEKNQQIYNTFTIISETGKEIARYDKLHLFKTLDEHLYLQPGKHLETVDLPWGRAGLAICYDIRFPELFRSYALNQATILLISAEWPTKRITHWKTLIRARAIENLAFVAAVNAAGQIGSDQFGGSSAIISPWGETLAEGNETDEALLTAEIDTDQVERARRGITSLVERRPDIYKL